MIYGLLFMEFFKIGSFAIGGGMVMVPFLFEMAENYTWFTSEELVNMIAVSESVPGPIGINMATYVGFKATGWLGSFAAVLGLVLPSFIIILLVAELLAKYRTSAPFLNVMYSMRPTVLALILYACFELSKHALYDINQVVFCIIVWGAVHLFKLHPVIYIIIGGIFGILLQL